MNIFFDMDGVLAKYERHAYDTVNGPVPGMMLFQHEPSHYFRNCTPDGNAIRLMREYRSNKDNNVYALSMLKEQLDWVVKDKLDWLEEYCPEIPEQNRIILIGEENKAQKIIELLGKTRLDKNDLLYDDYNKNLLDWTAAGGTAIKYLNGVNSAQSWPGLKIEINT